MKVRIFWKNDCPGCPHAKALGKELERRGIGVDYVDVTSVEGLTQAVVLDLRAVPSLAVVDGEKVVRVWHGETPKIDDVLAAVG